MTEKEYNTNVLPLMDSIYSYCRHMLGDEDTASDLTQDVMLKIWDTRSSLNDIQNYKAFALCMARNLCLDLYKKKKPVYDDEVVMDNGGYDIDMLQQIENRDMAEAVRRIIDTLPDNQKEVILLREIEEMEFEEISKITGLGMNNVRVLLSRARTKVRSILQQQYQESYFDN